MKKNLLAILAIIFCIPTFLFGQVPPSCPTGSVTPAENCAEACVACSFSTYTGTSAGWQGDPQPPGWCSNIQNDQWIGFIASTTSADFVITPSNCLQGQGLQAAIYAGSCNSLPLECNPGCATCGNANAGFSTTGMIPGNIYYLVIDGYSQDQCDFTVSVSPAQAALPLGNPTQISGLAVVCPGSTGTYSILPVANAGYYTWTSNDPDVLFNGQPGPVTIEGSGGSSVEFYIPVTAAGGSQVNLCVTPSNVCQTGTQRCKTITVSPSSIPTVLPPVVVCNEDAPYILPWGELANESGLYSQSFSSSIGCDSIVHQDVTILPAIISNKVSTICQGDSVVLCGEVYKISGAYEQICTSSQGCDSTIMLTLNVLAPVASIQSPSGPLSCSQPSLTLASAPSPSTPAASVKTWRNLATGATSTGDNLVVTTAGDYELCTSMTLNGVSCSVCDTVTVDIDTSMAFLEAFAAVSGPITCLAPATLTATSNMQGTAYTWISAAGGVGVDSVYVAANPGTYVLAAINGVCVDSVTVTVSADVDPGITTLSADAITCVSPGVVTATSNITGLSYEWITVDSTEITGPTFTTGLPGAYYLVTTNPANGCTWTGAVMVLENTNPGITTIAASAVTCTGPAVVTATSDIPGLSYEWLAVDSTVLSGATFTTGLPGTYSLVTTNPANGCTSTGAVIVLENTEPGVTTVTASTITCLSPGVVTATSNIPGLTYAWIGVDSTTITGPTFTTTVPGSYYLVTTNPANGCTSTGTVVVPGDTNAGVTTVSSPTLSCIASTGTVTALSDIPGLTYIWTGPAGPLSGPTITVTQPGVYTLITTNPSNGCTAEYQAIVGQDINPGLTTITARPITCDSIGDLTATSDIPGLFYSWVTPSGIILSTPSFTTNAAGVYILTTTNPANGCTWTETVTLVADTEQPQVVFSVLHATPGQSNGAISLNVTSGTPPFTFEWTYNGMFFSNAQNLAALEPGIYTVKITGDNGCVTTVDIQVMSTSATSESTLNTLLWKIAPNPASEYIQILWAGEGDAPGASVNGFDVTGKLMFNVIKPAGQAQLVIPCRQYPAGMYHVEIQPENRGVKSVVRVNVVH